MRISPFVFPRRRTIGVILLGLFIALPLAGFLYERSAAARDARRYPPAGALVDIGGRRLHLLCTGNGRPTIIVEASGFSNAMGSSVVRAELAKHTRVCSYDRMGVGWSDRGPDVTSIVRSPMICGRLHRTPRPSNLPSSSSRRRSADSSPRCSPAATRNALPDWCCSIRRPSKSWRNALGGSIRSPRVQSVPRPRWRGTSVRSVCWIPSRFVIPNQTPPRSPLH